MKTITIFLVLAVILAGILVLAQPANAKQPSKPASFSVIILRSGESYKTRIEQAARINTLLMASRNMDSKRFTLDYDSSFVCSNDIQKNIALALPDNEKYRTDKKAYKSLCCCCNYDHSK